MVKLFLLGSFELKVKDKTIHLPTRKIEALLAYLVLHRNVQNRESIASIFWGDSPMELARRSLRTALSALRKELGDDLIVTDRETIKLNSDFPLWVDVYEMEKDAKGVLSANSQAGIQPDLYRADLLTTFYDEWILQEREYYRGLFLNALLQFAQSLRTNGEYMHAIEISQKIISIDVTNERAYQNLMFCYGALGNRSAALKSYEDCVFQLQEKLGVPPAEDTNELYEHVKKSNSSGLQPVLAKSNLPIPLTSFIGREQELKTLKDIFGKTRLLTLTGVGGCGKTRLSIQLAGQIADQYADGVWWIGLASIQDEKLLVQSIKKALGIPDGQQDSAEESVLNFLHTRHALLVLDNCEHVVASCARLAESILMQCSGMRILATSREALNIHGEIAWLVPSLSLPPANQVNDLLRWECPRLFYERATSYRSDLQLTQANSEALLQICRALEGIPLAIELAASRVKTLSLEQLASRLDDKLALLTTGSRTAQPRQQTLRATIDWSHELLSEMEQITFRRLSILAGNWTLDAAESVTELDAATPGQTLDLITRLLDKSLLVVDAQEGELRYRMLEIIRQYAIEKLQRAEEVEKVAQRQLLYYSKLAQKVYPDLYGRNQENLMKQFDAEYPNFRVALARGLENPPSQNDHALGIKLASALGPFWNFIAEYNEGQMWLKKALEGVNTVLADSDLGSEYRTEFLFMKAKTLYEYGFLVWFQSHYDQARTIFLECSEIYKEIGEPTGLAYSNMFLAHSTWGLGERDLARKMWAESLAQFHKINDHWGAAMVHSFVGRAERQAANYDQAEWEYNQCLKLFGIVGDDWGMGISLSHLGMLAFQKDDPSKAMSLFEQRLMTSKKRGFKQSIAYSVFLMGMASWKLGDAIQVQRYMREALTYMYEISNFATLAECLLGLAWAEAEQGHFEQAAYLFGAVTKADETEEIRMEFENLYFHKPVVSDLQSRLRDSKYHDGYEKGRNSTLDHVAKEVLEIQFTA